MEFIIIFILALFLLSIFVLINFRIQNQKIEHKTTIIPQKSNLIMDYFDNLLSELSFIEYYELPFQIDFLLFSLFKNRLCVISYLEQKKLSEDKKSYIMEKYDAFMYLAIGKWMDKNAPSFINKAEITEMRLSAYNDVLLEIIDNPFAMSIISNTLYWFIANGWEHNLENANLITPKMPEKMSEFIRGNKEAENNYGYVVANIDISNILYCEKNIPSLIKHLKKSN